ncbi:endothelin-converting enzyme 1-like [Ixodes scapularis]|uniref:endothelin-converting enzyme 1-like n=1 Tax=Ixodes scapularis TaxID=6945 RepID=UPI001C38CADC|nr:endothelin-converting enzyme 1-like [Ixodes scapularis]
MPLSPVVVTLFGLAYFGAKLVTNLASEALFPWCDHPVDCFDFTSELRQSVDHNVDACEGLYDHTCAFWALNHPLTASHFEYLNLRILVELFKLLIKTPQRSSPSVFDKTVVAFSECRAVEEKHQEHLHVLLDVFKNYSLEWPSLKVTKNVDILEALVGLSLDFQLGVIFQFGMTIDFKTNNRYGFMLSASAGVDHNSSALTNHNRIRDCLESIPQRSGISPDVLAERIVSVNTEVRSLTTTFKLEGKWTPRRTTIEDVGNATSPVFTPSDWTNAVNKHLPQDRQINSSEDILVFNEGLLAYIKELFRGRGDNSIDLMIYVGWVIIQILSPGLSFGQIDCLGLSDVQKSQGCLQLVNSILPFSIGRLLFDAISPIGVEKLTNKILTDVKEATKQSFEQLTWMDNKTIAGAKNRVDSIISVVSLPEHLTQRKDIEQALEYVPSFKEPFIRSFMETLKIMSEKQKRLLVHDPAVTVRRDDLLIEVTSINAYYAPVWNMIIVPGSILLAPFVHPSLPTAVNYGAIGKVLGHELTHSFDLLYGDISTSGDKVDWYSKASRAEFERKLQCVMKQVQNASDIRGIGRSSIDESFADTAGVEKAYSAFSKIAKGHGLLGYNPDKLFFASGCFAFCATNREAVDQKKKYPPVFLRCDVPASNEKHFAETFKCPMGARLNPTKRCDFH